RDLDGHVLDALGARDETLAVPEAEGPVLSHEVGSRKVGAEEVPAAPLGTELEEDVLSQGVHGGEPGPREDGLQTQLAGRAAQPPLALREAQLELLPLAAAGRILEVGEPVRVVVDAVPADLAVTRAVVAPRAVVETADEGPAGTPRERAADAAAGDVAVAD